MQQGLQDVRSSLTVRQKLRAEQLAHDPTAFATLFPQIHLAFQPFADRTAASLLAHAAAQPACADAARKK